MNPWAILLAAGQGSRILDAAGGPKQFIPFRGAPLYWQSAAMFNSVARMRGIVFVVPADCLEAEAARLQELTSHGFGLAWRIVAGSVERQDSVRSGLGALPPDCDAVLVHDAARPFADAALANRLLDALEAGEKAAIPAIAVVDTIKQTRDGLVTATLERSSLAAVQTPQAFSRAELDQAHAKALAGQWKVTDDASLLEQCGVPVRVIEGSAANVKITRPEDLRLLSEPNSSPQISCTGFGYDVHRYAAPDSPNKQPARPMRLGGVPIPGAPDVLAHSDGDVLLHALMDALLGLCGKDDIGTLFPDNDPALDNANSSLLLDRVREIAFEAGLRLTHADCTLVAQIPKIAPWRGQIKKNLCRLLGLAPHQVAVKATTEEHLGFTGEKKGIKAIVVLSALRPA